MAFDRIVLELQPSNMSLNPYKRKERKQKGLLRIKDKGKRILSCTSNFCLVFVFYINPGTASVLHKWFNLMLTLQPLRYMHPIFRHAQLRMHCRLAMYLRMTLNDLDVFTYFDVDFELQIGRMQPFSLYTLNKSR